MRAVPATAVLVAAMGVLAIALICMTVVALRAIRDTEDGAKAEILRAVGDMFRPWTRLWSRRR